MTAPKILHRAPASLLGNEKEALWQLLGIVSDDFYPPLSQRFSSKDTHFDAQNEECGVTAYLETLLPQENLLAIYEGQIVGFLSYRVETHELFEQFGTCAYVTTISVLPEFRSKKIGRLLYEYLFDSLADNVGVLLRTWSHNKGHLGLLKSLHFHEVKRLVDHRGRGVDTVYMYHHHSPVGLLIY